MRTLNIVMSDHEHKVLERMKGRNTWKEWINDMVKDYEALNQAHAEMEASAKEKDLVVPKPPVMPQIPVILEEVNDEAMHKASALKRTKEASDRLFKVKERHKKGVK